MPRPSPDWARGLGDGLHYRSMEGKPLLPFPHFTPCFPDGEGVGEGVGEAVSLSWESGSEKHKEGGETASWLEQETPGRPGQRQAMG